jgi:hypothetical protein
LFTSAKRVLNFNYKAPKIAKRTLREITIDINNRPKHPSSPLNLSVYDCDISDLDAQNRKIMSKMPQDLSSKNQNTVTLIAEDDESLGNRIEEWAYAYGRLFSSHFATTSTAYTFYIGSTYASVNLPETPLILACLRVVSLNYVLRTGIRILSPVTNSHRTIQARIDSLVFSRLRIAESDLNKRLQTVIWKSYGRLTRQQLFPVAYVLWQYLRWTCQRASHLTNLIPAFTYKSHADTAGLKECAASLSHCFNLLLSIHTALFRGQSPLLLDFEDKFQRDLLDGREDLMSEVLALKGSITKFRESSYPKYMWLSKAFEENTVNRLRSIFDGEGLKI